ncbi:MAG TPA: 6-phosphofructokinase [Firmicutes bacterium]|nr:6-phosphofructokinase [Bacillota bacterium]
MEKIAVLTSGGDAPGMNAALRAVVHQAAMHEVQVIGISHGYEGLLNREFSPMELSSVDDIIQRGGTILRSARSERFKTEAGQQQAVANLREAGIEGLVVIGGEGSYRGAEALAARGVAAVGVPGTIDNDIPCTDYSIGFDTAVNTVVEAMNKIRDTATAHERTFVVETMGRASGQIALTAGLAGGAESILIPEIPYNLDNVCQRLKWSAARGKVHSIIVVAEGVASGYTIAQEVKKRTGFDTRVTVLGHLQRGGAPTAFDRILASRLGAQAVEALLEGGSALAISYVKGEVQAVPFREVFTSKKEINRSLYDLAAILAI